MSHLPRKKIIERLDMKPPLLERTPCRTRDPERFENLLQADTYDLRIGLVASGGRPVIDGQNNDFMLPSGDMAIILTQEIVNIHLDLAAEVSPPNYLLSDGLLVIAPSHVDPGYSGRLTARVINLREKEYHLKANDHVLTIRFCKLIEETDKPYEKKASDQEKISSAIKQSRDTFKKFILSEENIVLKKDLRREALIEGLIWILILVPTIGMVIPFSKPFFPFFQKLGENLLTGGPMTVVKTVAVLASVPLLVLALVWGWLWIARLIIRGISRTIKGPWSRI